MTAQSDSEAAASQMESDAYVIGLDVGGTRLKSGAVSRDGVLSQENIGSSRANDGAKALLEMLAAQVERIESERGKKARAIGIALPGAVEPTQGIVLLPGRLKGLEGFALVPRLQELVDVPVVADNDGRLSIVAEKNYGAARPFDWALSITLGTGVGSGVMLDGQILRDPHGQFGTQMSHIVMQQDGALCLTGARGTAEMLCSATALALNVRSGLQRGIVSILSDRYAADAHSVDFEAVIEAVERNDDLCIDELRRWTQTLGWFLVSAIHVYAPQIVILSGGAANAASHFLPALQQHVDKHLFRFPRGQGVPIVVSSLRDHAGVLGAGARAWELADKSAT